LPSGELAALPFACLSRGGRQWGAACLPAKAKLNLPEPGSLRSQIAGVGFYQAEMVWNALVGAYGNRLFGMLFWAALSPRQFILGKIQVWGTEWSFWGFLQDQQIFKNLPAVLCSSFGGIT